MKKKQIKIGKGQKNNSSQKSPDDSEAKDQTPSSKLKKISQKKGDHAGFPIVGMGASAGGLEAFEKFFIHMPPNRGIAFVLIPHLAPTHASILTDLLGRYTKMNVVEVKDGMKIEPNSVYVIPPNKVMSIHDGIFKLSKPEEPHGLRMPIDSFFRSLAADRKEKAICIILSGSGSDGTLGLKAISEAGGLSIVQEPATAQYDGMPKSAIDTGLVDFILPVEKMPEQLMTYVKYVHPKKVKKVPIALDKDSKLLKDIIMTLRTKTGHDFSLYKKSTILRRITRRMNIHDITDTALYLRYLQEHPDEVKMLLKEFLISVTSFFRESEAFGVLKKKIFPMLLKNKPENYTIRVWVPGCATGEEAYSVAIILKEYIEEHRRNFRIQIFGTDIDEDAIATARAGIYPSNISIDVNQERLRRFFVKEDNTYRIKKDIRESVIYAVQDVTRDAPFTKMDLISCRNLLIYFDTELQNKILPLFHYSLNPDGVLFLGPSESIGGHTNLFTTLDKKWKFFKCRKTVSLPRAIIHPEPALIHGDISVSMKPEVRKTAEAGIEEIAQKILLKKFTPPCVIIDEKGDILYIHGRTGKYLEPARGRATLNIVDMAREGLQFELLSTIRTITSRRKEVTYEGLQVKTNGGVQAVNLIVKPIDEPEVKQKLFLVVFEDVLPVRQGKAGREKSKQGQKYDKRISSLGRELQYTKGKLKDTIEEQQAYMEELKSANEEMQSTNEELQSTNEELETSKEELQSVNEELITVNSELQSKIDQLSRSESDMKNLLDNIKAGIIYLDGNLHIKRFNMEATRVFNMIKTDIGRPILDIVSGLTYENFIADAQEVLDKLIPKKIEVQTKDKNWYLMQIIPYRTLENVIDGVVVTFTDVNAVKHAEEKGRQRELNITQIALKYVEAIVETVREPLVVLDSDLRVISANQSFYKIFRVDKAETVGRHIYELGNRQWDIPELRKLLERILPENNFFENFKVTHNFLDIGEKTMLLNARRIIHKGVGTQMILLAIEDITGQKS